jgi:type I restriction enzyme, S subunit
MIGLLRERLRTLIESTLRGITQERDGWVPLKHVADYREGPGILANDFRDQGVPLLRIGNLVGDSVSLIGCGFLDPADVETRWAHLRVREGELLVSGSATSGLPVVVPPEADGAVPYTGLIRLWPRSNELDRDFLRFFLASDLFEMQIDLLKTGVGIQHWGPSHLAQVRMPLPDRDEQEEAVRVLDAARIRTLALVDRLRRQIDLLADHRQIVITAAVTGELDVAEAG